MSAKSIAALLAARGAGEIAHPGGTLLRHLERVEGRLRQLGAEDLLCLAGLAHAAYGTDGFDVALMSLDERPLLAEVAGEGVEQLVYTYAACDRERSWADLPELRVVYDRWTGEGVVLNDRTLAHFVDLSTVNELDVIEISTEMMDLHRDGLLQLFHAWEGLGSDVITAEAHRVLGNRTRG